MLRNRLLLLSRNDIRQLIGTEVTGVQRVGYTSIEKPIVNSLNFESYVIYYYNGGICSLNWRDIGSE